MNTLNKFSPRGLFLALGLGAVLAFVASAAAIAQTGSSAGNAETHVIVIKQMRFDPQQLSIKAGDRVEWTNQDIFTHTVTANDGSFDSGPIEPGQSWSTTIRNPGTIGYHCRPHPNMAAELTVSAAGTQENLNAAHAQHQHGEQSLRWAPPHSPEEIHPILVNFTAALLPLAFLSDVLGRLFRRDSLHNAASWMTLYAAIITPLTVAAGWWWKHAQGADLPSRLITVHQWLGTFAALFFIVLAGWRWRIKQRGVSPGMAYLVTAFVAVLALVYQGSLGGRMLFGH